MRHPRAVGLAVAVLLILGPVPAPAQDGDGWIGRRVFTKPGTVLKVGKAVVDDERREASPRGGERRSQRLYRVQKVNGPWLWLVVEGRGIGGWVKAEQVVPYDQAIDYFTNEIRANPSSATYNIRGKIWCEKHEYDIALGDYNEAIRLDARNETAYLNRGNLWCYKNAFDRAIADYGEAIRLDPRYALAYNNRGLAWHAKQAYDRAIVDFDEVIRLDPRYAPAYDNRGYAWSAKQEYDKAIADYDKAIRLDPKFASAYLDRIVTHLVASRDFTAGDVRDALDASGWRGEDSLSIAIFGHLGLRRAHREEEARVLLDEAALRVDTEKWPYPVVRFLRKEIDRKAMLAAATDNDKMTEAQVYLGLDSIVSGRSEEALPRLRWVKENGNKSFIEYGIALAEIDRIEGRKAASTGP